MVAIARNMLIQVVHIRQYSMEAFWKSRASVDHDVDYETYGYVWEFQAHELKSMAVNSGNLELLCYQSRFLWIKISTSGLSRFDGIIRETKNVCIEYFNYRTKTDVINKDKRMYR